jgi:gliding motility-associated-like protein
VRKKYRQLVKLLYLILFISLGHVYGQASFTTSPVAVNGTITLCQGNAITYTNTSTGTNNNTNYNWTFQGGNPNNGNQIGPYTVNYNNNGNFTTTLSLGGGNTATVNVVVTNNAAPLAALTIQNIGQFSSTVYNGVTIFRKCGGNSIGNFNFTDPNMASNPAGTTYLISWGDNTTSTISAGAAPQWPHTYTGQGNYTLSYTVTFPGGCTTTSIYQVYVGNYAPAITLAGSGSSSCLPNNYSFTLGTGNTTPSVGTTFQVIYNDGSPVTIINGLGANNLDTIFHQFTNTSCGVNSTIQTTVYQNSYAIQVLAINGCSPQGTFGAIGPISVANSVNANFVASPAPYSPVCVNSVVQYNDVSDPGSNVSSGSCDSLYGHYWTITPNSGYTLGVGGTLGTSNGFLPNSQFGYDWQSWTQGSLQLPLTWTTPGTYQLTLHVGNDCGIDTMTQTICVVASTLASFTLPVNTGCSPVTITPVNNSSVPGCNNSNFYNWSVISTNPQNCTTLGGPAVAPANSNLATPNFNFTGPGVYTLQLITGLNTAIAGNSCVNDTMALTVTIKASPMVSITPPAPICAGASFTPVLTANVCYGTPPIAYAWNFNPNNNIPLNSQPNPLTSNLQNPGAITYPANGTFPFSVSATNECGTTTANSTIVVQPGAIVTPGTYGPFCMGSSVQLNGAVSGGSQTGTWSSSVAGGTFTPNANALNAVFTPPPNFVGSAVLSLSSGVPPAPCQVTIAQTVISFQTQATVVPGNYSAICMNQVLTLAGQIGGAASSATWTSNVGGTFSNSTSLTSTYTPPVGYVGNIILTLTTNDPAGPCVSVSSTVTIVVNPIPAATVNPLTSVICSGAQVSYNLSSTLANTNYNWQVVTPLPAGVTASTSGTVTAPTSILNVTVTNNSTATQTISYTITPTLSGCSGTPITTQITVQPVATNVVNQAITVCPGANIAPAAFASVPVGSTFVWSNSNTLIGLVASGSGNIPAWNAPANNTNATIVGTISVTPTYNGCVGTPSNFVVTIYPTPAIVNTPTAQTRCSGVATAAVPWSANLGGISFTWSGVASSGSVTGFTPSGSGSLPIMTIINSGSTPQTITYTVIPTLNGCTGLSFTYTITINPTPVLTLSANQTVCGGAPTTLTSFSNSVAGGNFSWTLSNPGSVPGTVTGYPNPTPGSGQIPASTINNAGTSPYTLSYQVTPTANGCNGTSAPFTITINPAPTAQFSIANQAICTGSNTLGVTLSSLTAGVTFSWNASVPVGVGNFNPVSGTNTIPVYNNLTNLGITPLVVTITAQATTTGGSQCPGSISTYTITVNPSPIAQAAFVSNDTICSGTQVNIALSSTTPNTLFTWTAVNGAGITGGTNSVAAGSTIQQTLTNSSAVIGTTTYTVTPLSSACPGTPIVVVAYVNPIAVMTGLAAQVSCPGAAISPNAFTSNPLGSVFNWTNSNIAIGLGANGSGNIPSWNAPANNTNVPIVGTINVTPTYNGCVGTPSNFIVTINPTPSVTNVVLAQAICSGAPTTAVTWTSGVGASTFAWTAIGSSGSVSGFAASGSGNLPIINGITNSSNTNQTITYSVTATKNGCSGPTIQYVITVYPTPVLTLSANQTVCGGAPTVLTSFSNSVAGGNFSWTLSNPGSVPGTVTGYPNPTPGSGQIPASTINNGGTSPYTLSYQVTPTANGCNGTPAPFTITINPAPTAQFSIANQAICTGSNTLGVTLSSLTAGVTFSWNASVPVGAGNFNPVSGTNTIPVYNNLTNLGITPLVVTITAQATTTGGSQCPGSISTYTITINPSPIAQAAFVSNDTICSGTQVNIALSSTTPNTLFTWTAVNGAGITGGTNSVASGSTIQQTLTNSSAVIGTTTYTVTPLSSACPGTPIVVVAYVNPIAVMTGLAAQVLCPGAAISPNAFTSNPLGSVFNWTNSNIAIGLGANGSGNIPSWNAPVNNTNVPIVGTISVTPTYNGCVGTPSNFSVTINPTPSVTNVVLAQAICSGAPTTAVTWTSGVGASTFAWTAVGSSGSVSGFAASGSGNLPVINGITNSSNTNQTITYSVTATQNTCSGPTIQYVITVYPTPVLTLSANQTVCGGTPTTLTSFSNSVAGGNFSWTLSNPGSVPGTVTGYPNPTPGSGQIPASTINNGGTSPYTLSYQVTPTANGCNGIASPFTITINPAPSTQFSIANQVICTSGSTQVVNLTSPTAGVTFAWNVTSILPAGLGNFSPVSGTNTIPVYTNLTNSTPNPIVITITAQATTTGSSICPGSNATYTITVNPSPIAVATFVSNDTICSGSIINITLSSTSPNTAFTWTAANGAGITGGTNSVAAGLTIQQTLTNSSAVIGSINYSVTPVTGACTGTPINVIAYINPIAVMTGLAAQVSCPGAAISPNAFTSNPLGSVFNWTNTNIAIGLGANGAGNIPSWNAPVNNTNVPIVGTINVTPTYNGCVGTPSNFVVTINPTPSVTNVGLAQAICSGAPTTAVTWTSGVGASTFAWTAVGSSVSVSGFSASGSGNLPIINGITNSSNTNQTITYSVIATVNGCSGNPIQYVITVYPTPVLTLSANQTVCGGAPTALTSFSNSVAGGNFSWILSNPGSVPGTVTGYPNPTPGSGQVPASTINNGGTSPYTLSYQVTPTANGCNGTSAPFTITVNPAPSTQFSIANQVICTSGSTQVVNLSSPTAGVTFAWNVTSILPAGLGNFSPVSGTNTIPVYTNLTNSTPNPIVITITAQATTTGGSICPGSNATYTITVNPSPIAVATFVTTNPSCSNSLVTINLSSSVAGTTYNWTSTATVGITGNTNGNTASISNTLVNSTASLGSATYTITPSANGCLGQAITAVANVNPVATMAALTNISACPGATLTPTVFASVPVGSTFTWTNTTISIGLAASGSNTILPWPAQVNNSVNNLIGTINVTPTYNGCVGTPSSFTATIFPTPQITTPVLVQTLCENTASTAVTFTSNLPNTAMTWTQGATGANLSGMALGSGNNPLPVMTISNTASVQQSVIYQIQGTSVNNCLSPIVNYTINVNPIPVLVAPGSQTVCSGVPTSSVAFAADVAGSTFGWSVVTPVANPLSGFAISGTSSLSVMTLINSSATPQTVTYNVTPTAALCVGQSLVYSIIVNPSPNVVFSLPNQSICTGSVSNAVNLTSSTPNASITWSASVPNGIGGFASLSGTNTIPAYTLTNGTAAPLTLTITAISNTAGNVACPGVASTYTITVSPQPNVTVVVVNNALCSGNTVQISMTSPVAGTTFNWTASASAGTTGASNGSGASISQVLSNSTNTQGTVSYTITTQGPAANVCAGQNVIVPITVAAIPSIQFSGANQAICSGNLTQAINLSSNVLNTTMAWSAVVPPGISGATLSGSNTIPAQTLTNSTTSPLTIAITANATINGCVGPNSNYTIQVYPTPVLVVTPSIDTICSGSNILAQLTSNILNTTYQWTVIPNVNITGATNGSGATINQLILNSSMQLQNFSYLITPVAPGPNGGACPGTNATLNVWVNPVALVTFSLPNQTICSGTASQQVNITSATNGALITWTSSIPAGISGAAASGGATIPVQNLVNNTNAPITIIYSVSVSTNSGNCAGTLATYSITVNPIPVLSFSAGAQTICSGAQSTAVNLTSNIAAPNAAGVSYSWSAAQPNGITGLVSSGVNSIPVQTLISTNASPTIITFVGLITYTNNSVACAGASGNYTITVNPLPQVTITFPSPVICSNSTTNICFSTPVLNTSFAYTAAAGPGITGAAAGVGNCITQTLVNSLLTQGTVTYTVVATANGCSGSSASSTILINPNPVVTVIPPVSVCSGQSIGAFNFTSTPVSATYAWSNSNTSVGLSANGVGNISSWVAPINLSGGPYVATVSVTPTLNGCVGPASNFTITVNPTPTLTVNPQSATICSGVAINLTSLSNVASATFSWVTAATNVTGATNGSNGNGAILITQTLTNSGTSVGNVSYTITPQAGQCIGQPVTVPIIVNPIPAVTLTPPTQVICSGSNAIINITGSILNTNYAWTVSNNVNVTGAIAGIGNVINQTLTNLSTQSELQNYSVIPSLNGCTGAAVVAVVTVNPTPVITPSVLTQTICSGLSTNIVLNSSVLNSTYSYAASSLNGIIGASSGTVSPISQQLTNPSLQPGTVTYTVTASANSCPSAPVNVVVTVNPSAIVTASQQQVTICSGQNANLQLSSTTVGATFSWTITPNPSITGAANGSGATINQTLTNSTFVQQTFDYVVVPQFGNCTGSQLTIPVIVNPLPQIIPGAPVSTCISNPPFNLTGYSPLGGVWSGTGITNGPGATFSPAVAGVGSWVLTYSYTNPATGCNNSAVRTVTVNPLPVPLFVMDTLKCINTTVSITNNSTGAVSYAWNFGNGATSTQFNPLYQFPTGGNYTVTLTATSAAGCTASVSHSINIISTPTTSYNASTYSGCGPLSVAFTNTTTGSNITSYFWNFGYPTNGPFSSLSNPGTIIFPEPLLNDTTYLVSLSATNICGSVNYIDTILVFPTPNASFAQNLNNGCSPLPVNFINNSTGAPTAYIWNFGDGTFSTATNPSHSFVTGQNDTTYTITLIAINQCGSDTITDTVHVNPNTVTSFFNTTPISGCSPLVVQFTNFSVGANNYFWNFGDGQVSSAFSPSHTYYQSGVITAQLIVDNGCSYDTSNVQITVFAKPVVNFTVVNDTLCSNQAFTFVNSSGALSNTAWDFGDGGTSTLYNPTYTYSQGGNYTVTLVGTSQTNGCLDTNYVMVHVNPSPVLDYDTNQYIGCVPMLVQFNELSNSANFAFWNYDDNNTGIGLSSTHLYNTAGTYNPTVIAQNIFGCTDTAQFDVYAYPRPTSTFQLSNIQSCYAPLNVSVNNLSQGANAYQWDFGNGFTSALNAPSTTFDTIGNYPVTLIASNQFGCSDTSVQMVNIWPRPVADFTPSINDGCEDLFVQFDNTSSQDANAYLWNFGDGTTVQAFEPNHTYINPGQYDVSLIVMNAFGCFDTLLVSNSISVYSVPFAGFAVSPALITTEDPTIGLINTASGYQYGTYDFGNGILQSIYTEQYFYGVVDSGLYVITQIVYSSAGCSDTAYNYIQINLSPTLYIPNAFTPDADGENDLWFPQGVGIKSAQISIFNRWGEQVFYTNDFYQGWDGTYFGKMCPDGVYSWKIEARDINAELIIKSGHLVLMR